MSVELVSPLSSFPQNPKYNVKVSLSFELNIINCVCYLIVTCLLKSDTEKCLLKSDTQNRPESSKIDQGPHIHI